MNTLQGTRKQQKSKTCKSICKGIIYPPLTTLYYSQRPAKAKANDLFLVQGAKCRRSFVRDAERRYQTISQTFMLLATKLQVDIRMLMLSKCIVSNPDRIIHLSLYFSVETRALSSFCACGTYARSFSFQQCLLPPLRISAFRCACSFV